MHSFSAPAIALAALAAIPAVSAHGYLSGVVSGGKWYAGTNPNWLYDSTKPKQAGWFAYDQDLGFVAPDEYSDNNITCHKLATPGTTYVPVTAGSTIDLQWTPWPDSHHGPVITYLARCQGSCLTQDKTKLEFFKIDQGGLINDATPPGTWASDKLISNNNTWTVTIPKGLSGNFVLRNEIIALHSAQTEDGAQNYPMCVNIQISGSGTEKPCSQGATCRKGTQLYKPTDPGILIDIYEAISKYIIPGPALWSGLKKRAALVARSFEA